MKTLCAILMIVALGMPGCGTKPLVITGEGLKAVGMQFAATSEAVTKACIAKVLTVAQCDDYREFSQKFKLAFDPAVTVQNAAMRYGDQTMAQNAGMILSGLVTEMKKFTTLLVRGK